MKYNLTNINPSIADVKNSIKLPSKLTVDLAEFIGIMVGDGHVAVYNRVRDKRKDYDLQISGHINDCDYHLNYINNLIFKLFNVKFNVGIYPKNNIIILRKRSRSICLFLRDLIKIPPVKDHVGIPKCILLGNKKIKAAFLRGLADSDFSYTVKYKPSKYPVVHGTSKSKRLIRQCSKILKDDFKIKNNWRKEEDYDQKRRKTYVRYRVYINGFKRVELFIKEIGFNNQNKTNAYNKLSVLPKFRLKIERKKD